MFSKLLKHDLIYTFKMIVIYGVITLLCAALTRLTDYGYNTETPIILQIFHTIFYNCTFIFAINLALSTVLRLLARLKNNFYNDESYLTHTLPVNIKTLWASKFIANCLAIIASAIIIAGSFWLAFRSFGLESAMGSILPSGTNSDAFTLWFIKLTTLTTLQFIYIVQSGCIGLIIGYGQNSHRLVWSVLFGFITYALGTILLLIILSVWSNFQPDFSFFDNTVDLALMPQILNQTLLITSLSYLVLIASTFLLGQKLLSRGVNID